MNERAIEIVKGKPIKLQVFHHPEHGQNVEHMLNAMESSIRLFSETFGAYQFDHARIVEFPRYLDFAQAYAATMPYSEEVGFTENRKAQPDGRTDSITAVVAHEIAHQWWGHQLPEANKQGSRLLMESFAEYSALLALEKRYGEEAMEPYLRERSKRYFLGRGKDHFGEQPLVRTEDQPYLHYDKGGIALYNVYKTFGPQPLHNAMRNLLKEFAFKSAPFPDANDFLRLLKAELSTPDHSYIEDLFEKICLYQLEIEDVQVKQVGTSYELEISINAQKVYADSQGKETAAQLDENFLVGAFYVDPSSGQLTSGGVATLEKSPIEIRCTNHQINQYRLATFCQRRSISLPL